MTQDSAGFNSFTPKFILAKWATKHQDKGYHTKSGGMGEGGNHSFPPNTYSISRLMRKWDANIRAIFFALGDEADSNHHLFVLTYFFFIKMFSP